jgi:adenylate cyclase
MDTEDPIEMGGTEREITVLFSDIRGFTSMSEHVDALEMVGQLNEYFAAMVDVVGHHKGTLDKFLGDGMMAIFGAPGDDPDHAEHACSCALEMLDRLTEVNESRKARGLPELKIGIGVHTGVAVVGNVGSPLFRVDFTAIGDTVNLAARLEAASKELGTEIVVSADTKKATGQAHEFHPLGSFIARGRTTPTEVFGLAAGAESS